MILSIFILFNKTITNNILILLNIFIILIIFISLTNFIFISNILFYITLINLSIFFINYFPYLFINIHKKIFYYKIFAALLKLF